MPAFITIQQEEKLNTLPIVETDENIISSEAIQGDAALIHMVNELNDLRQSHNNFN